MCYNKDMDLKKRLELAKFAYASEANNASNKKRAAQDSSTQNRKRPLSTKVIIALAIPLSWMPFCEYKVSSEGTKVAECLGVPKSAVGQNTRPDNTFEGDPKPSFGTKFWDTYFLWPRPRFQVKGEALAVSAVPQSQAVYNNVTAAQAKKLIGPESFRSVIGGISCGKQSNIAILKPKYQAASGINASGQDGIDRNTGEDGFVKIEQRIIACAANKTATIHKTDIDPPMMKMYLPRNVLAPEMQAKVQTEQNYMCLPKPGDRLTATFKIIDTPPTSIKLR
jgi:hypothetical protein